MVGKKRVKLPSPVKTSAKPSSKRHQGSISYDIPKGSKETVENEGKSVGKKKSGSVLKKSQYSPVGNVPGATESASKKKINPIGKISMADTEISDDDSITNGQQDTHHDNGNTLEDDSFQPEFHWK